MDFRDYLAGLAASFLWGRLLDYGDLEILTAQLGEAETVPTYAGPNNRPPH